MTRKQYLKQFNLFMHSVMITAKGLLFPIFFTEVITNITLHTSGTILLSGLLVFSIVWFRKKQPASFLFAIQAYLITSLIALTSSILYLTVILRFPLPLAIVFIPVVFLFHRYLFQKSKDWLAIHDQNDLNTCQRLGCSHPVQPKHPWNLLRLFFRHSRIFSTLYCVDCGNRYLARFQFLSLVHGIGTVALLLIPNIFGVQLLFMGPQVNLQYVPFGILTSVCALTFLWYKGFRAPVLQLAK